MRSFAVIRAIAVVFLLIGQSTVATAGKGVTNAILVDKKTNNLYLAEYIDGAYKLVKTYHATLGQVKGDKEDEGDLKTPEGIYTFKSKLMPPTLAKKYGAMAFYMNFPNTYDAMAGRTGSNIMLHSTDTPDRLKKDYDSLGCVVVDNAQIEDLAPHIRLGLTPILIFAEMPQLNDEYMKPGQDPKLRAFFDSWIKAWETKNVDDYVAHYHTDFTAQGMNKDKWRAYKSNLNSRYSSITINPEDVLIYRHPKYSMITFTQNYQSRLKGGGWGHRSRGTKILYIGEEAGQPKIVAESYTTLMW